jgi:hypothetical protein
MLKTYIIDYETYHRGADEDNREKREYFCLAENKKEATKGFEEFIKTLTTGDPNLCAEIKKTNKI